MAIPSEQSIYDTIGTVLYCTVPVRPDAQWQSPQYLSDAENVPLAYETAVLLQEAEQASATQRNGAAFGYSATGAGSAAGGGAQTNGASAAGRRSSGRRATLTGAAAADGRPAASILTSTAHPQPPLPQPQRIGTTGMSARYGPYGGTQQRGGATSTMGSSTKGGGAGASSHTMGRRGSLARTHDDGGSGSQESVAAQNAVLAKKLAGYAAAVAEASNTWAGLQGANVSAINKSKTTRVTGAGSGITVGAGNTLTVADVLEHLFPIQPVVQDTPPNAEDEDGGGFSESDAQHGDGGHAARASSSTAPQHRNGGARPQSTGDSAAATDASSTPQLWRRADVGHTSRLDVVLLYQHLLHRCATESARPRGVVCPNRERVYNDALRELTRQITLLCPERGLLLDELSRSMKQSTDTYDVLLDSASQYAVRKSTERDLHQHLFAEKAELEVEVRRREHRVSEWRAKFAGLQKRFEEQQAADGKLHEEEIAYAKKANLQLVNEIKRLASEAEKSKES